MQNSIMMFTSFVFWPEISILREFGAKNQNYQFRLEFSTRTNSNMQDSMVMFTFSIFHWKCPFWDNLVEKLKIVSLKWILIASLIQICRIQWHCLLSLFSTRNQPFCANVVQKFKVVNLRWNLIPRLIRVCII